MPIPRFTHFAKYWKVWYIVFPLAEKNNKIENIDERNKISEYYEKCILW